MAGQTNSVVHFSVVTSSVIVRLRWGRGGSVTRTRHELIETSSVVSSSFRKTKYVEKQDQWHIHFPVCSGSKCLRYHPESFLFTRRKAECSFFRQIFSYIRYICLYLVERNIFVGLKISLYSPIFCVDWWIEFLLTFKCPHISRIFQFFPVCCRRLNLHCP
jgi:hypothetical protein